MKKISLKILLIYTLLFFTFSCKKNKQTDKPLYNVLTNHTWKVDKGKYDVFYKFNIDSILYIMADSTDEEKILIKEKWWTENTEAIYITTFDSADIIIPDTAVYDILLYNDYKIKTLFYRCYYCYKQHDKLDNKEIIFTSCN